MTLSPLCLTFSRFNLDKQPMAMGRMFGAIETHKKELGIEEYSMSQTSLEAIFNFFAAQQVGWRGQHRLSLLFYSHATLHAWRRRRRGAKLEACLQAPHWSLAWSLGRSSLALAGWTRRAWLSKAALERQRAAPSTMRPLRRQQ